MKDALQQTLKQLRLSGLAQSLEVRLQEAAGHQLGHAEFLELITAGAGRAAEEPAGEGGGFPRTEDPGRLRLALQSLDQEAAGV